jgi:hypothetical protein
MGYSAEVINHRIQRRGQKSSDTAQRSDHRIHTAEIKNNWISAEPESRCLQIDGLCPMYVYQSLMP